MGSGRDKRKKSKGSKPGQGAEKTAKKTETNEKKQQRRLERSAKGGDDDIDALLAQFKLQDEANVAIKIQQDCLPPGPRVYASFQPMNDKDILLFGGEYYDGERDKMHVYADVYVLDTEKMIWKRIISPNGPLPRTSHQAVVTRHYMYVFGGEFTSLNQEKFKHYSDLWRLELASWKWEQLPSKGGPSPRSGHRMALHKGKLLLFGGFFDTGKETRYYNDVWAYDTVEMKWECLGPLPGQLAPPPRGGCQLSVHPESNNLFMIGGYSVKQSAPPSNSYAVTSKRKNKADSDDEDSHGIIHDDTWALDLATWQWERIKKAGMAPTPRTSFGMVTHKGRAIYFGGVHDREGMGDRVYSELFNEAYQFNLTSRRWFPLVVRPPKGPGSGVASSTHGATLGGADRQESGATNESSGALPPGVSPELHAKLMELTSQKDSPLVRAATRIQAAYRGHVVRKAYKEYRIGGQISELLYSPAAYGIDLTAKDMIRPRARSAPMLAVVKHTLWVWGGMVEISHSDVVLDDLWSLNLNKLDGWHCVKENTAGEEAFRELSDVDHGESSDGWETD